MEFHPLKAEDQVTEKDRLSRFWRMLNTVDWRPETSVHVINNHDCLHHISSVGMSGSIHVRQQTTIMILLTRISVLRMTLVLTLSAGSLAGSDAAQIETIASPNGNARSTFEIRTAPSGNSNGGQLCYSIQFKDRAVLVPSPISLDFKNQPSLGASLLIRNVSRRAVDDTWQRVYGKRKQVHNRFNEMTLDLQETAAPNRPFQVIVRAYDDGIAFRYVLSKEWGAFEMTAENTHFDFPNDATVWVANFGGFNSSQESEFKKSQLNQLASAAVFGCPLLAQIEPSLWTAISEADLTDWAGMYFTEAADQTNALRTALSPHPDETNIVVRSTAPRSSPWRVVMVGEQPGAFIESDILENLNPPATFDTSWIRPGKSAWDIWWSGAYAPELNFKLAMDTRSMKYFVDLAAEMGWQYQIVDWGWYGPAFAPGAKGTTWAVDPVGSITNIIPELDLHELISYAKSKNVKLILWLHWGAVDREMDTAFPTYEKWGIAGVKIDFMNRDDQYMVNFYERTAKKAAQHHLLVDFHGAYKPTGWHRTYPNVITREGVMGNEYNKWSARVTPEHTVTLPFTRGMLGGMDFTPGGFRQKTSETFRIVGGDSPAPFVMGTRVHQLAMLVVYESGLQVLCDSPYNYRSSPAGTDFLKMVPTTWDDTKVVQGEVGKFITIARRSGKEWYLASMTGADGRTIDIPLTFLDKGKYEAEIWADAYEAADYPDRLMKQTRTVNAGDSLTARLAAGGGYIVRLKPR
jgi:alpha-glucosidase